MSLSKHQGTKRPYEAETETMTYNERLRNLPLGDAITEINKESLKAAIGNNLRDKFHTLLGGEGTLEPSKLQNFVGYMFTRDFLESVKGDGGVVDMDVLSRLVITNMNKYARAAKGTKNYTMEMWNMGVQLLASQFALFTGMMELECYSAQQLYEHFRRCFSHAHGGNMQWPGFRMIVAVVVCGKPPHCLRPNSHCHTEESDKVLRPEVWSWKGVQSAMMHLYGGDEFKDILENVDKKMADNYNKKRAAKAAATAAHPVTVGVPNDLIYALSSKQDGILNFVQQIFKDYEAGPVIMVGVNVAVIMALNHEAARGGGEEGAAAAANVAGGQEGRGSEEAARGGGGGCGGEEEGAREEKLDRYDLGGGRSLIVGESRR